MINESIENVTMIDSVIQQMLVNLLSEQGIRNYKINNNPGSKNGDNYLGIIIKTEVEGIDKNGEKVIKNYVLKCAHTSEGYRKLNILELGYKRESYVYAKLLPFFEKFQKERDVVRPFDSYPKCFAYSTERLHEALIMEDMAVKGYKMQNRLNPLNVHHCKLVLRELGKWHGLSFALRDQMPKQYEIMNNENEGQFVGREVIENGIVKRFEDVEKAFDPLKHRKQLEKYYEVTRSIVDDMYKELDPKLANGYEVILHGDCWINNMIFKYENPADTEYPSKICFLDWQLSRIGSPLIDVLYFIYNCTDKQLRDEYFYKLMNDYYTSLSGFVKALGSEVEKVYPESVFKSDIKKFSRWAMGTAFLVIPLITTGCEDLPNFAEEAKDGRDVLEVIEDVKTSTYSMNRIRDCFLHMYENNFL